MLDNPAPPAARFMTFEGGEGVGKSTQVDACSFTSTALDIEAVRTREPGGTPKAEAVRAFILQGRSESWGAGAEAVLFAAARLDHVNQLIGPSLAVGKWVISDRFSIRPAPTRASTGGVDEKLISGLEVLALTAGSPTSPSSSTWTPTSAFARVSSRQLEHTLTHTGDRFEKEDLEWHRRLREAFLGIAEANPDRCVVIPANKSEDDLEKEIWSTLTRRFPELEGKA